MLTFKPNSLTHWRYLGLGFSVFITLWSFWMLWRHGLHLGLDFTGGVLLELEIGTLAQASELNAMLPPSMQATVCTYINVETNGALATNLAAWMKTAVIHAAWLLDQVCVPSCNLSILPVLL